MPILEDMLSVDIVDYPYTGAFYTTDIADSGGLIGNKQTETLICEVKCDIQKTAKMHNGNLLAAAYTIYFPLEKNETAESTVDKFNDILVRRAMTFKGKFYGVNIEGEVELIRPSQLGGCSVDIKVVTEDEESKS
jgi:hypothetical protein